MRRGNRKGFTLIEMVMALALMAFIFSVAGSVYASGLRFFSALDASKNHFGPAYSMEYITRRVLLGNNVSVTQGGAQLNIRLNYDASTLAPIATGDARYNQYWAKYALISNGSGGLSLLWATETAVAPTNIGAGAAEVIPGVVFKNGSVFARQADIGNIVYTSGAGFTGNPANSNIVAVTLITDVGTPPVEKRMQSSLMLHEMSL